MNEKAFAESLAAKLNNSKDSPTPTDPNTPQVTNKKTDGRPSTPPADYESTDLHNSESANNKRYGIY